MRSPRPHQHCQRVSGFPLSFVEPLETRRLLSATGAETASHPSALLARTATSAKAERLVPNPRDVVLVNGHQQKDRPLKFGTFAQGAAPVTITNVQIKAILFTIPFGTGDALQSVPPHFSVKVTSPTATPNNSDGDKKLYDVAITFNPTAPGTFSGPIIFKTDDNGSIFLNVTATVLPTPVGQVTKLDVLQPAQRTGNVNAKPGLVSVAITNPGAATLSGKTEVQVFASTDPILDDADVLVGTQKLTLTLPKNAGRTAQVRVRYPDTLPTGNYFLIAKATGAAVVDPAHSTVANPVPQTVVAPTINLHGVSTTGPAFTTATRHNRVSIPVQNLGTVNARGTRIDVDLFVSPTATINPATLVPLTSYRNLAITPKAQSQAYQAVTPKLPDSLPAGFASDTFYIVARITRFSVPKNLADFDVSPVPSDYFVVR